MVGNGYGFFPTQTGEMYSYKTAKLYYRDTLIDEAYENNKKGSLVDIVEYVENREFDEQEIRMKFNDMMNKIRSREKMWDVKVSDFIEKNYRLLPIMEDVSHPADALIDEIGRQVAIFLNISDIPKRGFRYCLGLESFCFPGIKKALGIEYPGDTVRLEHHGILNNNKHSLTLSEYIQEYIYCFYKVLVE
jgi:hypothetical protein